MKHMSRHYLMLLSCILFGSPTTLLPVDENSTDKNVVNQEQEVSYVCFDKSMSDIANIVFEISALDTNLDSPIHLLRKHLENGYLLGLHDEVVNVLEYADWFVKQYQNEDVKRAVAVKLDSVIDQVLKGDLDMTEEKIMRCPQLRLLTIDERLKVLGKATFKNIVVMEKKLRVHGEARFYDDVEFKDDVEIDGTLSVQDQIIGCDLTVGCNINMVNSIDSTQGNIVKDGNRFVHNFGIDNTFVGVDSGNFTMTGSSNTGVGVNALASNTVGFDNTGVGRNALPLNTAGSNNTAIGRDALNNNLIGNNNTAVGKFSLAANIVDNNTAVGYQALQANTTGTLNTAVGITALLSNTTGVNNVAVGHEALVTNTIGIDNTAVGVTALANNTTGESNTGIGFQALRSNTTGFDNTGVGRNALQLNTDGSNNTAVGRDSLNNNLIGNNNTAVGKFSLAANLADDNTAVGYQAMEATTTGILNTAIGVTALINNTVGANNVAVGFQALGANVIGSGNVAVGWQAGNSASLTGGSNNTFVGNSAGAGLTANGDNNTYLGNGAGVVGSESNTIRIGNPSVTAAYMGGVFGAAVGAGNVPVIVDPAGQLGTILSSKRFKHDIQSIQDESVRVYDLNPVTFVYNQDVTETSQFGLIAEEVSEVFPELVVMDKENIPLTVRYEILPVLLLCEMQKLAQKVATMDDALVALKKQVEDFIAPA